MTITVRAPNGANVQFPAGTDAGTINRVMGENFGGPQQEAPVTFGGVAKNLGGGLVRGVAGLAGLPGTAAELIDKGIDWGAEKLGLEAKGPRPQSPLQPTGSEIVGGIERTFGALPQPQNTAEEYASTLGEFAPGVMFGGPRQIMSTVIAPALTSETAGQLTKGTDLEPYARAAGAVGGAFLPGAARRVVTPLPSGAERTAAVQTLRDEGVTELTAGQTTGRKALRYFESEKGGATGANMMERQGEQFTAAALRRAGVNSNRATPEVIDEAFTRIGGEFDGLAARNNLQFDAHLNRDLVNVFQDYTALVPPNARAPIVENMLNDLVQSSRSLGGTFAGESYQAIRSRLDKAARSSRVNDPQLSEALFGIRNALDTAMERSIARSNPTDLGAWREARRQYRNMLVIENAATAAGENAALGLISPAALRTASKHQGKRAYARGQNEFADLARSGVAVMNPLPQSGTAPRLAAQGLMTGVGALAGGGTTGTAEGGALGALAGLLGPRALARVAMSRPGRAYLGNQAMAGARPNPHQLLLLESILGSRQLRDSSAASVP